MTDNPEIRSASSLIDYVFRWLEMRFATKDRGDSAQLGSVPAAPSSSSEDVSTGLACPDCGSIVVFAEGCLTCRSCGYTKCG